MDLQSKHPSVFDFFLNVISFKFIDIIACIDNLLLLIVFNCIYYSIIIPQLV